MIYALWVMGTIVIILCLLVGCLIKGSIQQDEALHTTKQRLAATKAQLDGLTEDYYDLKQEFQDYLLGGECDLGDGVYREEDDPDPDVIDTDWNEFDPFADPPEVPASSRCSL